MNPGPFIRWCVVWSIACGAWLNTGCSGGSGAEVQTLEDQAAAKCPKVHLDRMAGDWLLVSSGKPDVNNRIRVFEKGQGYGAWYVGGLNTKVELIGEKRDKDVRFVEVPSAKRMPFIESGEAEKRVLFLQPVYKRCAMDVYIGTESASGVEKINPKPSDFAVFPESAVQFTFQPPSAPLFLGPAASNKGVADKQMSELGGPKADIAGNPVPVGTWTSVEEDGPETCAYDMDLYFNDKNEQGLMAKPAGKTENGFRHWYWEWDANYEGNYNFEMHQYRTCEGKRELIRVAGIEATLY